MMTKRDGGNKEAAGEGIEEVMEQPQKKRETMEGAMVESRGADASARLKAPGWEKETIVLDHGEVRTGRFIKEDEITK